MSPRTIYSQGFSLTETIVVIALFSVLLLAIMNTVTQIYKYNSATLEQANEIEVARRGLLTWVRDAREMTFGVDGSFPIERADTHRMGFYSDIDKDLSVEYVEYVLSSTTLYKYTYEATGTPPVYSTTTPTRTETLSQYVQNLLQNQVTFRYYNEIGTQIASSSAMISDVRYIRMNLIVNIDPLRSPGEFMLQGSAAPRNLKENL
jgi:prepilin-type N-terminal cleavage/methylation domain-containing protein